MADKGASKSSAVVNPIRGRKSQLILPVCVTLSALKILMHLECTCPELITDMHSVASDYALGLGLHTLRVTYIHSNTLIVTYVL